MADPHDLWKCMICSIILKSIPPINCKIKNSKDNKVKITLIMAYKKRVIRNTSPIFGKNKKRGLVFSEKIRNADCIPNRKNFQDFQPNCVQISPSFNFRSFFLAYFLLLHQLRLWRVLPVNAYVNFSLLFVLLYKKQTIKICPKISGQLVDSTSPISEKKIRNED